MAKAQRQTEETGRNGGNGQGEATYFLSLTLSGVRCFGSEPQTLDLSRGGDRPARWTIILGENGTGKTTILQSLAGVQLVPLNRRTSSTEVNQANEDSRGVIGPVARLALHSRSQVAPLADEFCREENSQGVIEVTIAQGEGIDNAEEIGTSPAIGLSLRGLGGMSWKWLEASQKLRCYGYGASRRFSDSLLAGSSQDDPVGSLFADDFRLRNAEEWLLQVDYSASKESPIREQWQRLRELVKEVLLQVLPDDVSDVRVTDPTLGRPNHRVEFRTKYGWVGLRNLGHGYRTLIAWVVDLASRLCERAPDSLTPLDQPAVVLVDEIDLHMHPVWQRKVMTHLTRCFPNAQFIVTAHSPLIVQAAGDDANVALLRREGDHVVIENNLERIRNWRVDQLLTSDLFNLPSARPPQFDELFARRKEILEKKQLTKEDRAELTRIEKQLGPLPTSETGEVIQLMSDLKQTLGRLAGQQDAPK